jgi:hypothetical protein
VSGYGLEDRAIEVRSLAEARDFSLTSVSRPDLGPTQIPAQCVSRVLPGGKARPGRKADHSPHVVPRFIMSRSYTSSPPALPYVCCETALPLHRILQNWNKSFCIKYQLIPLLQ